MTAQAVAQPAAFAVDVERSRALLDVERSLWRLLDAIDAAAARAVLNSLGDGDDTPDAARLRRLVAQAPRLPAGAVDRAVELMGAAVDLGTVHAAQESAEQIPRAFANVAILRPFADPAVDPPGVKAADQTAFRVVAEKMVADRVGDHYAAVVDEVTRGLDAGLTNAEIADRIQAATGRNRAHSATAARTEATRLYTVGRLRGGEAAGDLVWGYEYVVIVDTNTTDICRDYAGRRVAKEDLRDVPPLHYNCRTTLRAILREAYTGRPEQPPGTAIPPSAAPMQGFGEDPRRAIPLDAIDAYKGAQPEPPKPKPKSRIREQREAEQAAREAQAERAREAAANPDEAERARQYREAVENRERLRSTVREYETATFEREVEADRLLSKARRREITGAEYSAAIARLDNDIATRFPYGAEQRRTFYRDALKARQLVPPAVPADGFKSKREVVAWFDEHLPDVPLDIGAWPRGAVEREAHVAVIAHTAKLASLPTYKPGLLQRFSIAAPGRVARGAWAWASPSGEIRQVAAAVRNPEQYQRELNMSESSGFHPPGCNTREFAISHEYGHLLQYWREGLHEQTFPAKQARVDEWDNALRRYGAAQVSGYATANRREAFAESFASLLHTPADKRAPLTNELHRILVREDPAWANVLGPAPVEPSP